VGASSSDDKGAPTTAQVSRPHPLFVQAILIAEPILGGVKLLVCVDFRFEACSS
jgi:hypothetical protein